MADETVGLPVNRDVPKTFKKPSRAKQAFKNECDVNIILSKYMKTGVLSHVNGSAPRFGDFTNATDYQTSLNRILEANSAFEAMPAKIRARFANDPAQLIAFVSDPANRKEAEDLGLVEKRVAESGASAPAASPQGGATS